MQWLESLEKSSHPLIFDTCPPASAVFSCYTPLAPSWAPHPLIRSNCLTCHSSPISDCHQISQHPEVCTFHDCCYNSNILWTLFIYLFIYLNDTFVSFYIRYQFSENVTASATFKKYFWVSVIDTVRFHNPPSVTQKYLGNILVVIPWCLITYCTVFKCCFKQRLVGLRVIKSSSSECIFLLFLRLIQKEIRRICVR